MDELNQMQGSGMPPPISGPMGPMPAMPGGMPGKKKSMWLWVIIAVAVAVAGAAWWYINRMVVEPVVQQQPAIDQEARKDMMIGKDIQAADSTNIDAEFQSIDSDLNSL